MAERTRRNKGDAAVSERAVVAKPLGRKAYGSIGHLPGSRLGPGDHHLPSGQDVILTSKPQGRSIFVQEKVDGSCVSVARIDGEIVPLIRAGYRAEDSRREFHHDFAKWTIDRAGLFASLLADDERVVGEWLALAHGTRYTCAQPFVAFDIMVEARRATTAETYFRCLSAGLETVALVHVGAIAPEDAVTLLGAEGRHRAHPDDGPEGVVYRAERNGEVEFLGKWVRPDKADGKYLADISGGAPIWNWVSR